MTPNLDIPLGLSQFEENEIHEQWQTSDQVQIQLQQDGFLPFQPPGHSMPSITSAQLNNSTSMQFSEWFTTFAAWQGFLSYMVNWVDALILEADNELKVLAATIRQKVRKESQDNKTKKPAEDVIADMVYTNPRWIQVTHTRQTYVQRKLLLEPQYEYCKTILRLISRHLSIREYESNLSPQGGRSYGGQGQTGMQPGGPRRGYGGGPP